jgi:hypothetical protein
MQFSGLYILITYFFDSDIKIFTKLKMNDIQQFISNFSSSYESHKEINEYFSDK